MGFGGAHQEAPRHDERRQQSQGSRCSEIREAHGRGRLQAHPAGWSRKQGPTRGGSIRRRGGLPADARCAGLAARHLSLGAGQRTAIYFSMQADPVDYGVWKTGINTAGILTSINGFLGKVAMAGAGAITGALLSSGGYIANQAQSDSALLAIKACYLYIPALLILASMLWMGRFYRLDDQYEQIRADLDAGRGASPAPAPTAGESPAM